MKYIKWMFSIPNITRTIKISAFFGLLIYLWQIEPFTENSASETIILLLLYISISIVLGISCVRIYYFLIPKIPNEYQFHSTIIIIWIMVLLICFSQLYSISHEIYFDDVLGFPESQMHQLSDFETVINLAKKINPAWIPDLETMHTWRVTKMTILWIVITLSSGISLYFINRNRKQSTKDQGLDNEK